MYMHNVMYPHTDAPVHHTTRRGSTVIVRRHHRQCTVVRPDIVRTVPRSPGYRSPYRSLPVPSRQTLRRTETEKRNMNLVNLVTVYQIQIVLQRANVWLFNTYIQVHVSENERRTDVDIFRYTSEVIRHGHNMKR